MTFLTWMKISIGSLVLLVAAMLAGCTVVVEEGVSRPGHGAGPGPMCTRQYDPVCARRGNDLQTFSNSCLADAAGYRVVRGGACNRGFANDQRSCTQQYSPVCARRGGDRRTFANSCLADRAGYRTVGRGECGRSEERPRACTREFAPVCARRGSQVRTFPNGCEADSAGFRIVRRGSC